MQCFRACSLSPVPIKKYLKLTKSSFHLVEIHNLDCVAETNCCIPVVSIDLAYRTDAQPPPGFHKNTQHQHTPLRIHSLMSYSDSHCYGGIDAGGFSLPQHALVLEIIQYGILAF